MKARRTVRHRRVGYRRANLCAATATGPTGRRASSATRADPTTPDTSRHPGRTDGNVPTTGRVVYTSKRVSCLTLGKTSARYGEQVPTPHYGQPRYRTIADELRRRIENGVIPPGALLPSESALAAEFRASRGTIRQAIAALREARLVRTEHGRGTHASPLQHEAEQEEGSDSETRQRQVDADPELAALFAVEVGTTLLVQQRVTWAGGVVDEVVRAYRVPRSEH
ncbi:GntR family transcriptional regulator [Micromonospora sp. WMMD956]|uniref:GntR family transcriptional regulator n=1 Tax=Micromonospora sp. WMMD956 TaxID=3016108 RepID=UPI002416B946|nr:GntR family transcriptional regulator [Micromonospora sp. WMMD956]MDG4814686.1 GntR family transcriptional regulator [Micromonospora sp. WMMD956]